MSTKTTFMAAVALLVVAVPQLASARGVHPAAHARYHHYDYYDAASPYEYVPAPHVYAPAPYATLPPEGHDFQLEGRF